MKKYFKILTPILDMQLIFFLLLTPVFSQTITIGTDTTTTSAIPTTVGQNFSYTQQIFTSGEIGQTGTICGISLFVKKAKISSRTIKIYLGHTNQSNFSSNTNWISSFSLTEVFHGSIQLDSNSWNYINFNVPFLYNGIENLVIAIDDNTQVKDSLVTFRFSTNTNSVLSYSNNSNNPSIINPPAGIMSNQRNNIKLHFYAPILMSNIPVNSCDFHYADPGGAGDYAENLNITQTITSSSVVSNEITISFMEFNLGTGDTLWIYNGLNTNAPLTSTLTSGSYPFSITVSGSSVTFRFQSDGVSQGSGWLAFIDCTTCNAVSILNGSPCQPSLNQNSGYAANPFCTDNNPYGVTFPSATSGNGNVFLTTPVGCLSAVPRPAWYFMQINTPGDMLIQISQTSVNGNGIDVDFACWGPFYALNQADFMDRLCCGEYQLYRASGSSHSPLNGNHTSDLGGYPINNLVDCSFSPYVQEWCFIPNAQANQFYILLITNYNGSDGTISFNTVAQYTTATTNCTLLAQVSNNGPICEGSTLQLTCNNPQPNATYAWTGPNGFTSNIPNPMIPNATSLQSGVYSLVITSNNISSSPSTTHVTIQESPNVTISVDDYSICQGENIHITASGANSYTWSHNLGNQSSIIASPSTTTTYILTGSTSGCTDTAMCTIFVHENPYTQIEFTGQSYCPDDGTIPVSSITSGGGGIYNYAWSGSNVTNLNTDHTEITLNPTDCNELYTVLLSVTDQNGCPAKDTAVYHLIDTVSPWFITLPFNYQYAVGTYPNYTIPNFTTLLSNNIVDNCWSGNGLTYSQNPLPNTPITEAVTVQVTVSDYCNNDTSTYINVLLPLYAFISNQTNCTCYGSQNGTATVAVSGGLAPYSYLWSTMPVQTTQTATSLGAGSYSVTVTDALLNSVVCSVEITQPNPLSSVITGSNVLCHGTSTGSTQIVVSGGTPPYQYLWSNGSQNSVATNLQSANYHVTVTDIQNCILNNSISISEPNDIQLASIITPNICLNNNGAITVNVQGGTPPYQYIWNTGATTSQIIGLSAGIYSCTITDQNNCFKTKWDTIEPTNPLEILNVQSSDEHCYKQDGTIQITVINGTEQLQYHWNNGSTSGAQLTNLKAGFYFITVTDFNQCTDTTSVLVDSFIVHSEIEYQTPALCGDDDGTIGIKTEGGSGTYIYDWFQITDYNYNQASHLAPGHYLVTIQDGLCIDTIPFTITEIPKPIACFEGISNNELLTNQRIFLQNCSESATYYEWKFDDMMLSNVENPVYIFQEPGIHVIQLTAINDYNCKDSVAQIVRISESSLIYIPNSFTPNNDGLNDIFIPSFYFVNTDGYSMKIFNRWGEQIFVSNDISVGWDGTYNNTIAPSGTYTYTILFQNLFGQPFRKVGTVHVIR